MTCSYCRSLIVKLQPTCPQCGGPLQPCKHEMDELQYEIQMNDFSRRSPYFQRAVLNMVAGGTNPLPFGLLKIE